MTSATEKLRRMLDERGVEYDGRLLYETEWTVRGVMWHAKDYYEGKLLVYVSDNNMMLTPEQAVEATLGGANVDDALALLDEMNEQGRIGYADYSQLHDAIADEQIVIEEPDAIRNEFGDNGLLVDDEAEQDSRKKLESDCAELISKIVKRTFSGRDPIALRSQLLALLDRQAAITRREVLCQLDERDERNAELRRGMC